MKNKAKQTLSVLLILTLVLSIFAGCGNSSATINNNLGEGTTDSQNPNNEADANKPIQVDLNKWVLTSETYVKATNAYETTEFGYDSNGRLNYRHWVDFYNSDIWSESTYTNIVYDKNGNVKSCTELYSYNGSTHERLLEFKYNKNNELIKTTLNIYYDDETYEEISEYEYDDNGNLINKTFTWSEEYGDGKEEASFVYKYSPTYVNGLCTFTEIFTTSEYYIDGELEGTESNFSAEKYTYDSNNNKTRTDYYTESSADDADFSVNGTYYSLNNYEYSTYTWQRLGDIVNGTTDTNDNQVAATTATKKLSDDCDKILASGYNTNNDYYELVAIVSESYNTQTKVGVIKNNKWLIEPTSDAPFIDENGALMSDSSDKSYIFCCESCFAHGYSGDYGIVWNVDKNIVFDGPKYPSDGRAINVIRFKTQKVSSDGTEVDFVIDNYTKVFYHYSGTNFLNTNTMEIKHLEADEFYHPAHFSNGLFYSENYDQTKRGFYDEDFNLVIDLSDYNITTSYSKMYFDDGVCYFKARNSSGISFIIGIDTNGNIISETREDS